MFPSRRTNSIVVAVPDSITTDTPHLREKTAKLGLIARTAAVFRISEIVLYRENLDRDSKDSELVKMLLDYATTPQYLRKTLFPLNRNLTFAGILPPLRTPNHPLERFSKNIADGEIRDGYVFRQESDFYLVDVGLEKMLTLKEKVPLNAKVIVYLTREGSELKATRIDRASIPIYWGFETRISRMPLGETVRREKANLDIATSKFGTPIKASLESLKTKWSAAKKIVLAFGPPTQGIPKLLKAETKSPEEVFDFLVNSVPEQGTETVRTEEALIATLGVLNLL